MKKITLLLIVLFSIITHAQDTIQYKGQGINILDKNGLKAYTWKLYNEEKNVVIVSEFKNGELNADTKYYKDDVLFASYNNSDELIIYKDDKTYKAKFLRRPDGTQILVDKRGDEIDKDIANYFYSLSTVYPMFYGGKNALFDFISNNVNSSSVNYESGRVILSFVIDVNGKVTDIEVTESTNSTLNDEAKRIISLLPRWQPAHQRGVFVKAQLSLPITFN